MFKRFFGKSEKEKEEERLRRELEAEKGRREQSVADQRIALKAATKPLQLVVDGVPTEAGVKEVTEKLQAAIKVLDIEKAGQELSQKEKTELDRLRAHAQGVKVDPKRFGPTFTKDKQEQLKELELRSVVSEEIASATKELGEARQKQRAFAVGKKLHEACTAAVLQQKLAGAMKALEGMQKAYAKSGYTRTEAAIKTLKAEIRRIAVSKLGRVWRGHEGRKAYAEESWKKDKFRIEAKSLFVALDETRDGYLSISELRVGLARAGYSKEDVKHIVQVMDEDGSGEVDEEEFISSFRKALTKRASPALKFTLDSTKVPKLSGGGAPKAGELRTGDRVWYRRQDGSKTEALIYSIDYGHEPPTYVVKVKGGERLETEEGSLEAHQLEEGEGVSGLKKHDSMQRLMDDVQLGSTVYIHDQEHDAAEQQEDDAVRNWGKKVFLEEEEQRWETQGALLSLPEDGGGSLSANSTGATEHVFGEIHFAAKKGDVIRVWALVNKAHVPVDALTSSDSAPIHFAALAGHEAVISVLVALGADVNRDTGAGHSPLHCAAANNRYKCIRELARLRADVDRPASRSLSTSLHWAARNGHVESVETLVQVNATLDARDWGKNTPLMYAARHGRVTALERLIELKADLRAQNSDGKNALFHAAETGQTATCMKLTELGLGATEVLLYGGTAAGPSAAFLHGPLCQSWRPFR